MYRREKMNEPMSNFHFKVMSFIFKIRDLFKPPDKVLKEAGIESGFTYVLFHSFSPSLRKS